MYFNRENYQDNYSLQIIAHISIQNVSIIVFVIRYIFLVLFQYYFDN